MAAYQSSQGAVSDYIRCRLTSEANKLENWDSLKANLAVRLSEITNSQVAFSFLRKVVQKEHESVQIFAERLIDLAKQAFFGQEINSEFIDRQLVGFFKKG